MLELDTHVRAIVAEGSGMAPGLVIPGNDTDAAPSGAYATVTPVRYERPGIDERHIDGLVERVVGNLHGVWSVQWYGNDDFLKALNFHQWCQSAYAGEFMEKLGLTFNYCSDVRQFDEVVSWGWERRAGLEFMACCRFATPRPVEFFDTVSLDINLDGIDATTEITHDA